MSGREVFPELIPDDGAIVQVKVTPGELVSTRITKHVIVPQKNTNPVSDADDAEEPEISTKTTSTSALSHQKRRADPTKRRKEYDNNNERRTKARKAMAQEERDAMNAKRREAYKKKKKLEKVPELNSTAMYVEKKEREGLYNIRTVTRSHEVVTHYHSIEMGSELPKVAKDLLFKNSDGNLSRARTTQIGKIKKKYFKTSTNKK